MKHLFWDTETSLIRPGLQAPPLSCVSYEYEGGGDGLLGHKDAYRFMRDALEDKNLILVGHNVGGFDWPVIAAEYPDLL